MPQRFGEFLKNCRMSKGLTLREFCRLAAVDPGNFSKMERGLLPPPRSREKLESYAAGLGLIEGTDEWLELFDLAAAEEGMIPADVVEDEELLKQLPILFRTARGQRLEEGELKDLVAYLKSGGRTHI